ncbi:succinate-semialdehyde dehydrogenase [Azospirillum thiophilum]|uniref:Succinate-semialdehyde dehydrogenase n=1 Tax=Azospirillum thiophilum TaxID=528244 RepID=A0AAC8ZV43_9PROT|nr:NAD-dependent succinate-semialdehyde dehydrogenase [Azospirillum thiophilum]ALG72805.1 succinate-semialdehyde dehydrogenase [Azospirillum thiophilum]KJR64277.1 succinate-semialdehyde dehydrogenase [Azospirillum thiophilum]
MTAQVSRLDHHDAVGRLSDRRLLRELAYVGGRWTAAPDGATFAVFDPASGRTVARVAALNAPQATAAISAAAAAFPAWSARLPQDRAARLRDWFDRITAAREDLALLMTLEQGKPLAESRGEIDYAASFVEWYAEEAKRVGVESVASHLPDAEMLLRREPLGVVGVATPWNFPSAMLTRKAAAALAAGCTVVAHAASATPLSALALAELAERAGIPGGVLNILTGAPEPLVGALCDDARVRAMSFTGSTEIGRRIAARCAPTMKRLVMELGGHAPLLVFADADLERTVDIAIDAKFATSGQDCLAANRIYVQRPLYDAFCAAFSARTAALRVGPGLKPDVQIGPLMHGAAVAKCAEHVRDAVARGARCLTGGAVHPAGPLFYRPTVLADVAPDSLILREETFGPVAALLPFDDEAEVVARANDTDYGLVAYLVTRDANRILRLPRALQYGMVAVNRVKITGAPIPFGGVKQSGLGREGSRHGLEAFTDLKYVCLDAA